VFLQIVKFNIKNNTFFNKIIISYFFSYSLTISWVVERTWPSWLRMRTAYAPASSTYTSRISRLVLVGPITICKTNN
jgi:hypothetical protein